MVTISTVTDRRSSNWALRAAMLMHLPAILIVGSDLMASSKNDTQTNSFGKPAIKRTAPVTPTIIFETDEELEDDDLIDAHIWLKELTGINGLFLTKEPTLIEPTLIQQVHYFPYQIAYSLNPRAPPAL